MQAGIRLIAIYSLPHFDHLIGSEQSVTPTMFPLIAVGVSVAKCLTLVTLHRALITLEKAVVEAHETCLE